MANHLVVFAVLLGVSFVAANANVLETSSNGRCQTHDSVLGFDVRTDLSKLADESALEDRPKHSRATSPNAERWFKDAQHEYVAKPSGPSLRDQYDGSESLSSFLRASDHTADNVPRSREFRSEESKLFRP